MDRVRVKIFEQAEVHGKNDQDNELSRFAFIACLFQKKNFMCRDETILVKAEAGLSNHQDDKSADFDEEYNCV